MHYATVATSDFSKLGETIGLGGARCCKALLKERFACFIGERRSIEFVKCFFGLCEQLELDTLHGLRLFVVS